MRLELEGHNEIGMFLADVVPKGVNVITAKRVFASKTDSDGYIKKTKARLVARGFGQQLGVDYFNTFASTPTVSSIKVALASTRCRTTGRYTILMLASVFFRQTSTPTFT